ncbi:MAG: benzoyl-CoA reductase, bzd-type, subunit Q [Candidatus Zixiibacteriota bacterium]
MAENNNKEFWRWTEYNWLDENKNWRDAEIISAGVDVGSVSSQAVLILDGALYAYNNVRTGSNSPDSALKAMEGAIKNTGMTIEDINFIVGTGYGRVNVPFSHKAVTEIACHARGANFMGGSEIRTILDMGGQDCKAIHCDERGKVTNFKMNDKCAAGTGRGMEVMADLLEIPITEIGDLSFQVDEEPPPVSSTCVVFAKSEAMALLRDGWSKSRVLAAYCAAMAQRVASLLESVGVQKEFFITGGIAKNRGVVQRLEKVLGIEAVKTKLDTQIAGALGAALFAKTLFEKRQKKGVI